MEEVDAIVIHTLRQIGSEIENISSLKEFTTEIVIEGVVRCLKIINSTSEFSCHVPQSMSARYRLGSALAIELTELGYKGEIGYQTFLYSNEHDVRKIFLFLIEKLPKENEKVLDEPLGSIAIVRKEASHYFKECLNTPWLPFYCKHPVGCGKKFLKGNKFVCKPFQSQPLFIPNEDKSLSKSQRVKYSTYFSQYMLPVCNQILPVSTMICSVFAENEKHFVRDLNKNDWTDNQLSEKEFKSRKKETVKNDALELIKQALQKLPAHYESLGTMMHTCNNNDIKGSRFSHILDLQFTSQAKYTVMPIKEAIPEKNVDAEERQKMRELESKEIQEQIDNMASNISQLELQNKKLDGAIEQISNLILKETEKIETTEESYRVKKCTLSLLPDAENNIEKLEGLIESSSQRLVNLANQWEQHRVPLIEKYRELKEILSLRQNETQRKLEEIKQRHDKIRDTGVEARYKEELYKKLISSYEKLTKDLNRSAYTRRILEIVSNIKKQKSEINKVLLDTRSVQKEINRLSGKLERTFTVTDELIFRDAKKDEAVRRAYKLLAALHENCSQLVQITEDTGVIVREIRELEDQIEQENQKKVIATLERITSDYKQMQQENALLMAQLK